MKRSTGAEQNDKTVIEVCSGSFGRALRRMLSLAAFSVLTAMILGGCGGDPGTGAMRYSDEYVNTAPYADSVTQARDTLGRTILNARNDIAEVKGKYVGIFYFLWLGEHGNGRIYDNSVIEKVPGVFDSEANWIAAGGGSSYAFHFWGKPLYGYYFSMDRWVMRKHVQLLTDAGIDFLVFDTTNGPIYADNALALMKILHEYKQAGWDTPGVVFYTNSWSGETMEKIYRQVYELHPEFSDTWFFWDGKPLIIGSPYESELSDEARDFFKIKRNQWPNEDKKDDAFPWMEFDRLLSDEAVYGLNGRREVVSVSVAQHNDTKLFSETAWYGGNDRSRSWHDGKNDTRKDSWLYGFNLEEQFEWALSVDPEIIFITGWNEWLAQRQPPRVNAITFVDNANINCSRDIEPMEGGYGDNYYMQMISLIRRFKGIPETPQRTYRKIDVNDGFSQWNDVENVYRDYENDTVPRNSFAYDMMILEDGSGRNDIVEMKVCEDAGSVYFFARTREPLTEPSDGKWMNLFIATYGSGALGYDLVVNYRPPEDGKAYAARIPGPGSNALIPAGTCEMRYLGDMIQVKVPKSMIGALNGAKIWFKWTDNCSWQEDGADAFYTTGDAAPIGRAGYAYGYDF